MIRAYNDDSEVLALADEDGCGTTLREALAQGEDKTTTVVTDRRIFLVHTQPGDAGYSAFEVADPALMPMLLAMLAPLIGPVESAQMRPHDRDPQAHGTRH